MGLLKSASNIKGVDLIEYRDQNYYDKYVYRARVTVKGLQRVQYASPEEAEKRIIEKKFWGRTTKEELESLTNNLDTIKAILRFKEDNKRSKNKNLTIRAEYNTMTVFHNDLDFLHQQFDNLPNATVDYTMVETQGYAGIKTFANEPKHKYRVYFKSKRVPAEFRPSILKILETNKSLRASPAFKQWLKSSDQGGWKSWYHNYCSSNYFIDYDDESYLSYLALMHGEHMGKKYKLEKRTEAV